MRNQHVETDGATSAVDERNYDRPEQGGDPSTTRRTLLGALAAGAALTAGSGAASGADVQSHDDADEYKQIVKQHYQATADGNLEKIGLLHSSNFVGHGFGTEPIDLTGLQQAVQAYKRAIPDLQFDIHQLVAEGDFVVAYVTASGTHDGRFAPAGLPASGAPVEFRGFTLHRFREYDRKIVEEWLLTDMYGFEQQAGDAAATLVDRVWEEAWNNGELAVIDEVVASDYVGRTPQREFHGPQGFKDYIRGIRTAFPDITFTIDDRVVKGTTVVDEFTGRGTHKGEFMGIEPKEKPVEFRGMVRHRIAGGQLVEDFAQHDMRGVLLQLRTN